MGSVLVTGGLGFIGAHVVHGMLAAGSDVVVIDRAPENNAADEVLSREERAAVQCVAREIPAQEPLAELLSRHGVETVVHLASPLATVTEVHEQTVVDQLIAPSIALFEACRREGVRKVVWASSVGVFGMRRDYASLPIGNDAPHHPITLYGAAKSFLERMAAHYTAAHGLDTLGLRFPLVYGPARQRGGGQFTTRLIEGAALGKRCEVESADDTNSWMYVEDVARSVMLAAGAEQTPSRALTVVGHTATTREVAAILSECFPEAELVLKPGESGLVAEFDPAPALAEIGYSPAHTLRDGLLATANAARDRAGLPALAA